MKAQGYWELNGTCHAWFGGPAPEGAVLHKGEEVPGPPPPGPDPRDKKIAELEATVAAMDTRLKTLEPIEKL